MKNQSVLNQSVLAIAVFVMFLLSCKKKDIESEDLQYRKIAWDYIDKSQQATVITKWENAKLEKPSKDMPENVAVYFNTTQDAFLGPIIVYISIKSKKVSSLGARF